MSSQSTDDGAAAEVAGANRFGQGTWEGQLALLQQLVGREAGDGGAEVLEAGCGEYPSPLGIEGKAHFVGVDTSAAQLARNTWADEKIEADIVTYPLTANRFDVVVCWDVLEHLPTPERAMENLVRAARPGGLVVLKVPNVMSAKGLITKFTPHRFHIWIYKHAFGHSNPGVGDRPPFRTYLRWSIRPRALRGFGDRRQLLLEMLGTYEGVTQQRVRQSLHLDGRVWTLLRTGVRFVTLGSVDPVATELIAVFRKPPA